MTKSASNTNFFFNLTKQSTEDEKKRLLESSNLKFKMAMVLLLLGLVFILSDIFSKSRAIKKKESKKPKKAGSKDDKKKPWMIELDS